MALLSGDKPPASVAWAVTAKISPDSSARKLPLADSTSKRLAQPRVMTMPTPNSKPPMSAPEMLPLADTCRALPVSSQPINTINCTPMTAEEKASNHTDSLSPKRRCQNSMTAARRQKRERCAKKPKDKPIRPPPMASTAV